MYIHWPFRRSDCYTEKPMSELWIRVVLLLTVESFEFFENFRFFRNFTKFSNGYSSFWLISFISVWDFILVRHSGFKIIIIGLGLFNRLPHKWSIFRKISPRWNVMTIFMNIRDFILVLSSLFWLKLPNIHENCPREK